MLLRIVRQGACRLGAAVAFSVIPAFGAPPPSPPPAAKPAAPAKSDPTAIRPEQILQHVNLAIRWYREVQASGQLLSLPTDVFFLTTERDLAVKGLQGAFATARSALPLVPPPPPPPAAKPAAAAKAAPSAEQQRLARLAADRAARIDALQAEISGLDQQIKSATGPDQAALAAKRSALQSEVQYLDDVRDTLQKMGGLLNPPGDAAATTTLSGQIDSLQQSVADEVAAAAPPTNSDLIATKGLESGGIIARTGAALRLLKTQRGLDAITADNAQLETQLQAIQGPLRTAIRTVVQDGDKTGDTLEAAAPGDLPALQHRVDALTGKFQALSGTLLPIRQEEAIYDQSRRNLQQWRDGVHRRDEALTRSLIERTGVIAVLLGLVLVISEIVGRTTRRYVTDVRRLRNIMLVRRLATGTLMVIVAGSGFISDFGSLATFAGLLTAGIALALQTIIVSIAAYFFLLGRYGLKVGDRITAGGVTGEVEDVGLVRFYLKELVASGPDLHPTGRVVVFPNSVIFQATPLFKQLPGTAYNWHEASVVLAAGGNASHVREKMLAAVTTAYGEYRRLLEEPRAKAEKVSGLKTDLPKPYAQLRPRDGKLELAVGYPVNFDQVSEIDQLVLKHVSEAIAGDPDLQKSIDGHPRTGVAAKA